jgi:hypothetical protein
MTQRELLSVRLCDLNVSIEGTWLEERIERVRDELAQRDLRFPGVSGQITKEGVDIEVGKPKN